MPAQNTTRPHSSAQPNSQSSSQPSLLPNSQPDTQQGIQSGAVYQAKPARRTHRRLLTPPLAQKNGIDPIQLILPLVEELPAELTPNSAAPATIADYLIARFYPNDPQIIHARFDTGEVRLDDGTILTSDSPYMPGERIWYFRELADEPQLPSDMPVLYEDEHVLAIDKPHFQHRQVSKTYRAVAPVPADPAAAEQALSAEGLQVRSHIQKIRDQLQVQQLSEQECAAQGVEPNTLTTVKILRTFTPSAQAVEGWRAEPTLNEKREWALYDLVPHTGKTHQLRAHLNLLGSPILGDVLYPQVLPDAPDRPEYPLQLLAYSLHFEHPITGERVDLYSGRSLAAAA